MNRKLLFIGNSHLACIKGAQEPSGDEDEKIIFSVNMYENGMPDFQNLVAGKTLNVKPIRDLDSLATGKIRLADFDAIVIVGLYGGPGDWFRLVAPMSFTGSPGNVPGPSEVKAPYVASDKQASGSYNNPPISSEVMMLITSNYFDEKLTPLFAAFAKSVAPVIYVPTPPLSQKTVETRFGKIVVESRTGELINSLFHACAEKLASGQQNISVVSLPQRALSGGWLKNEYRASNNDYEIHANSNYGAYCMQDARERLES